MERGREQSVEREMEREGRGFLVPPFLFPHSAPFPFPHPAPFPFPHPAPFPFPHPAPFPFPHPAPFPFPHPSPFPFPHPAPSPSSAVSVPSAPNACPLSPLPLGQLADERAVAASPQGPRRQHRRHVA